MNCDRCKNDWTKCATCPEMIQYMMKMKRRQKMANKLKFCPMLTGKEEVKALTIGQGDCVVPTFHVCLQEHCAAFVEKCGGEKWCNHYHSFVECQAESEDKE